MDFGPLLEGLWISMITIFVIMDPVASIPSFIAMTRNLPPVDVKWAARQAVLIAGLLAIGFLLVGPTVFGIMGITLPDFRVAGGLVLGILALEMVLGISFKESKESKGASRSAIATLIATPMLTGPGLMSSTILLAKQYGYLTVIISLFPALIAAWVILDHAASWKKKLGDQVLEIISRLMGLLLLSLAVTFVRAGMAG